QAERHPPLRVGRRRAGDSLDQAVEIQEAAERGRQLNEAPAARLAGQFLGLKRLQAKGANEARRAGPRCEMIGYLDELVDPAMELCKEHRLGRRGDQPLEYVRRFVRSPLADGVEEC